MEPRVSRLLADKAVLVVVDVQERLLPAIHDGQSVLEAVCRLVRGASVLGVPVLWTEQNPDGLGPTVPALAELLPGKPIPKRSFSCCGEEAFGRALAETGRRGVLLAGIEAHVCVYQTVVDLVEAGGEVHLVADAVGSRSPRDRRIAIWKMAGAGAAVTTVEIALFEMLRVAEGDAFKNILGIVK